MNCNYSGASFAAVLLLLLLLLLLLSSVFPSFTGTAVQIAPDITVAAPASVERNVRNMLLSHPVFCPQDVFVFRVILIRNIRFPFLCTSFIDWSL